MNRIVLVIVVAAVVMAMRASAAERSGEGSGAIPTAVADAAGTVFSTGASAVERTRFTIGRMAGRVIGRSIRRTTERNAVEVAELKPAMSRASGARRERVRDIDRRRMEADSLALLSLEEGRPLAAVRNIMRSRGLVDAMRHQLTEELVR
jgi:hypothetical protein